MSCAKIFLRPRPKPALLNSYIVVSPPKREKDVQHRSLPFSSAIDENGCCFRQSNQPTTSHTYSPHPYAAHAARSPRAWLFPSPSKGVHPWVCFVFFAPVKRIFPRWPAALASCDAVNVGRDSIVMYSIYFSVIHFSAGINNINALALLYRYIWRWCCLVHLAFIVDICYNVWYFEVCSDLLLSCVYPVTASTRERLADVQPLSVTWRTFRCFDTRRDQRRFFARTRNLVPTCTFIDCPQGHLPTIHVAAELFPD